MMEPLWFQQLSAFAAVAVSSDIDVVEAVVASKRAPIVIIFIKIYPVKSKNDYRVYQMACEQMSNNLFRNGSEN